MSEAIRQMVAGERRYDFSDEAKGVPMRVFVVRRSDAAEVEYLHWTPGETFTLWDAFWFTEGNCGCDCNRHLAFERAHGREPSDDELKCGGDRYAIRLEVDGQEPWSDL